jgi:hypothetical protein
MGKKMACRSMGMFALAFYFVVMLSFPNFVHGKSLIYFGRLLRRQKSKVSFIVFIGSGLVLVLDIYIYYFSFGSLSVSVLYWI